MSQTYIDPKTGARHEFPDDATPAEIDAATQPAPKGILGRSYDALGDAGAAVARKGHELATPVREFVSDLNRRLPEGWQDKDLNTATPEDVAGTGRFLAQEIPVTAAMLGLTGGTGALARAGAGVLRAGPLATRVATTAGQMTGGALGGANVAEVKGGDPLLGAILGGAAGVLPGSGPIVRGAARGGMDSLPAVANAAEAAVVPSGLGLVAQSVGGFHPLLAYAPALYQILKGAVAGSKGVVRGAIRGAREGEGMVSETIPSVPAHTPKLDWLLGRSKDELTQTARDAVEWGSPAAEKAWTSPLGERARNAAQRASAGTPAASQPVNPGLVTPTGEASAGTSGQPSSLLEKTLASVRAKPTSVYRYGPEGLREVRGPVQIQMPVPPGPSPVGRPASPELPMTRAHVPTGAPVGTPVGPLPPPPPMAMPQPSGTAGIVENDKILQSALDVSRQWRDLHNKGFRRGGVVR